jgi:CRP/FNR family transcriptional regulator, cyclic AMP receptor protein
MNTRVETLQQIPLFKSLSERSLQIISGLVTEESYDEGHVVIEEGSDADKLYVLITGEVEVVKNYLQENSAALTVIPPTATFGEIGLIDHDTRSATVVTTEPSHFLILEREPFQVLLQNNIDICLTLLKVMCSRLRQTSELATYR